MSLVRQSAGLISYRNADDIEVGREWFRINSNPDSSRTLRATCEMDEERILRDVVLSVDSDWKPLDSHVRLFADGKFSGSSWFYFSDDAIECEAILADKGRISTRLEVPKCPAVFAAHALACDGWQAGAYNHLDPTVSQPILSSHCSLRPDGGSGPEPGINSKKIEFLGDETITVPAGTFKTKRYNIHPERKDWPPLSLWSYGDDNIMVKLEWDVLDLSYILTEFAES